MAISNYEREYNMSDADLCMFVSNMLGFMNRDETEFASYGVDAGDISDFEALGNEFEVFPTDEEFKADVSIATEDKDAIVDTLMLGIRKITTREENKGARIRRGIRSLA